jgi:hypothetical protein
MNAAKSMVDLRDHFYPTITCGQSMGRLSGCFAEVDAKFTRAKNEVQTIQPASFQPAAAARPLQPRQGHDCPSPATGPTYAFESTGGRLLALDAACLIKDNRHKRQPPVNHINYGVPHALFRPRDVLRHDWEGGLQQFQVCTPPDQLLDQSHICRIILNIQHDT